MCLFSQLTALFLRLLGAMFSSTSLCLISIYVYVVLSLEEGLFFQIDEPEKLAYIYQINPSYHIGTRFPKNPFKNIHLMYADPPEGCVALSTKESVKGQVVLLERGNCPFVDKVLNAQQAGAQIALITDSAAGGDDFIDMVTDDLKRKAKIPCAWLPGVSGRRLREYLVYESAFIPIQIPLNYTTASLRDTYMRKPPWELW